MNRILFIITCLICSLSGFSQIKEIHPPDLKLIRQHVRDYDSPLYYPRLMKRYLSNDTTLNQEEYRHLYFGYSFQEGYDPYRETKPYEELKELYSRPTPTEQDCDTILKYAQLSIDDFPFDLRQMNLMAYAYKCKNQIGDMEIWNHKMRNLINTILYTGNGEKPETAWYVIHTSHEYDVMSRMGLTPEKYTFIAPSYDYIEVKENAAKVKGSYFNVVRILDEYNRKFK